MGFLKKAFAITGEVTGKVIGEGIKLIGNATDSDFLKEVGEGVYQTTKNSGEILGQFAEGSYTMVKGAIGKDKDEVVEGLKDVGAATGRTVTGIGKGMKNTVVSSFEVVSGAINDDSEAMKQGASKLAKTALIGAFSIGVLDAMDIIGDDGAEIDLTDSGDIRDYGEEIDLTDSGDISFVHPHVVHTDGGDYWRDGDGDTGIDLSISEGGGFLRSSPRSDV